MRRLITLLAILTLGLVVACGGGDDDSSADSDSSGDSGNGGSSSPSGSSKDNFCAPEYADAIFEDFDPTASLDDLEGQIGEMNELLDRWANDAPSEIRGDIRIIVDTMKGFFELLEENDFDFLAAAMSAADDPRLAALDSADFNAAVDHLNEYCGYDIDSGIDTGAGSSSAVPDSGSGSAGSGFTQGTLPEDFPENLIPPDSTIGVAGDFGIGAGAEFTSTATIKQVLDFYKDALGDPTLSSGSDTLWSVFEDNKAITVAVSGTDGDVEIIVTVATP